MSKDLADWKKELKVVCEKLIENGISIQDIPTKTTIHGKREFTLLKDVKINGVNFKQVIQSNDLDENFPIGNLLNRFRRYYNGTVRGKLSEDEIEYGIRLGIIRDKAERINAFNGGKITNFHINVVRENLDNVLNGTLTNTELLQILEEASIDAHQPVFRNYDTVKRIVEYILRDDPEKLEKYNKQIRNNMGQRKMLIGKEIKPKIGGYHIAVEELKNRIIQNYLPQILSGEVTFEMLEKELSMSHHTINRIIEEYYKISGDSSGLEEFRKAKRRNYGVSLEERIEANRKREELKEYTVVTNPEFLLLSEDEQMRQIVMKSRIEQSKQNSILSEETTKRYIEDMMNYFRKKNDDKEIYFTDAEIRFMIYRVPALVNNRRSENLDDKIDLLMSYDEISKPIAYSIIKRFPSILGYSAERTKGQLDLLKNDTLVRHIIQNPQLFMDSEELMYALIQFAKERSKTGDLTGERAEDIFLKSTVLHRKYGETYATLKARYPYPKKEQDEDYIITGEEIGKMSYKSRRGKSILQELIREENEEINGENNEPDL